MGIHVVISTRVLGENHLLNKYVCDFTICFNRLKINFRMLTNLKESCFCLSCPYKVIFSHTEKIVIKSMRNNSKVKMKDTM